jgi:dTDP-4-dehydrorhamnose 3,5-epimerase
MKIIDVKELAIPDVKVIRFGRFRDERGYFSEHFRKSDFDQLDFMRGTNFLQMNDSYSKPNTVRGLHFQWKPYMGKLVRTVKGSMVDIFLDIRKGSKTFGKGAMYHMPFDPDADFSEWIWVPVGFAHGNYYPEESQIEYLCTSEYGPGCEGGISPIASDIDWGLCDKKLLDGFNKIKNGAPLITEKDRDGFSIAQWEKDPKSEYFKVNK